VPFGSEGVEPGIGLALSGGGFRAALFHTGAMWRLFEFGVPARLNRISSVSGGSIFLGVLACAWREIASSASALEAYKARVVEPLRQFCSKQIDTFAIGEGFLGILGTAAEAITARYAQLMPLSLGELPDAPLFIFDATNLQTGRSFRFSKPYMGDYRIGLVRSPDCSVAKAVAASSAFPPFLSPVVLENPGVFDAVEGATLNGNSEFTKRIYLADGGVYDNLGLETVVKRCQTILASDAGAPFSQRASIQADWVHQPLRALDIALDQAVDLRKRALIGDYQSNQRSGTYWGISTDIGDYKLDDSLPCLESRVAPLASMRTRLNPFSEIEQGQLINWGYAVCDAAVRKYAPEIVETKSNPAWPCPEHPLS
jgi:NTE family protein